MIFESLDHNLDKIGALYREFIGEIYDILYDIVLYIEFFILFIKISILNIIRIRRKFNFNYEV